mmetsp:Transcript_111104/g.278161  ORF Transcript_111104/g.278161 Transcript_111104/m.278161 type:complete len:287 (+) Transcript_111104:77-937(+)
MAMATILLLGACITHQALSLKTAKSNNSEVEEPESNDVLGLIEHQLLICNAYASNESLAVYRVRESRYLTGDVPMAYKECRSFPLRLQEGEGFEFQQGDLKVGTFSTTGLPQASTTLLLAPVRRSPFGRSAKFMSHAFVENKAAEVIVVDAFGSEGDAGKDGAVKIVDQGGDGKSLPFGAIVPLGPGKYELALDGGSESRNKTEVPMETLGSSRHVAMRVGIDAGGSKDGESFPQELVVFPQVVAVAQDSEASPQGEFAWPAVLASTAATVLHKVHELADKFMAAI